MWPRDGTVVLPLPISGWLRIPDRAESGVWRTEQQKRLGDAHAASLRAGRDLHEQKSEWNRALVTGGDYSVVTSSFGWLQGGILAKQPQPIPMAAFASEAPRTFFAPPLTRSSLSRRLVDHHSIFGTVSLRDRYGGYFHDPETGARLGMLRCHYM